MHAYHDAVCLSFLLQLAKLKDQGWEAQETNDGVAFLEQRIGELEGQLQYTQLQMEETEHALQQV